MRIEYDPEKDATNRRKHGLPLAFGAEVLKDPGLVEVIDDSADYGEERVNALGAVCGVIYAVTYTERTRGIRFISVRPADRRETDVYFAANGAD